MSVYRCYSEKRPGFDVEAQGLCRQLREQLGVQGLKCASRIIGNFNTNCASDVGCGIYEMLACVRGAYLNVLINVDGILDTNRAGYFKRESAALMKYAETLAADLDDKICACI